MTKKKKKTPMSLSSGRPPLVTKQKKSMTRTATKFLINKHHLLEKRKQQAIAKGDKAEEEKISAEIEALGGLEYYQQASLQGQRRDRGGDSSTVLMQWLYPRLAYPKTDTTEPEPLRMLEIGALSTENACSESGHFEIERIDLRSQEEGILQQDFMQRPLPTDSSEKFDILSLSLVLNFVPDAKLRGDMLRRTIEFLHQPGRYVSTPDRAHDFPSLFLVLPAPCVTNSRYLTEEHLVCIMSSLGYSQVASKTTKRLVYYLWKRDSRQQTGEQFTKKELRSGSSRNNFAIILK
ncbi:putative methyltransferase-domain-containing protein [Echria macrotheca]|uniref:25S rRNA adenine-N(1) methyltransferase n=1 Tax=Echria macrotheca TaxID=438768 RepID=A0AAJ0F602_9PEZI|nr:putative methyltransferase-domain-containing protein [Echria macrotheca]